MKKYPNILIYNQPFNSSSGGGITLSNLFLGWPREDIAVACIADGLVNFTNDICNKYYQLGQDERKWRFPLNLIKKTYPSGVRNEVQKMSDPIVSSGTGTKQFASKHFDAFLQVLGLNHCDSRIRISRRLKKWLDEFQPEILYLQISTREDIIFAHDLIDYLRIPVALHMMDDWPSTIIAKGLFRKIWARTIDKEFRQLLDKVDLHLSISDAMSEEYFKRYQKSFTAFHNPVDIKKYDLNGRNGLKLVDGFRILYIGRVGTANKESIIMFARVISQFKSWPPCVTMDVFTKEIDTFNLEFISNSNNIKIRPPVPHHKIPALLQDYDLLLLPLDFTEIGLKFARLSIPTKASEYMLSGTPILVFAPKETAVSKFFSQNKCGYCVTRQDTIELEKAVRFLINDREYCKEISHRAMILAKEKFNAENVRLKFQRMLIDISIIGN